MMPAPETTDEFWDAILSEFPKELHTGEFTVPMLAKRQGVDCRAMQHFVDEQVKAGKLTMVGMRRVPGHKSQPAYAPVVEKG